MRCVPLLLLGLLTGCQCCGLTERYQDRVDAFADREGAWEVVYSPAFDLTRIGRSDWCSYPVNHWWCPCRCEKQGPPPCPHVWYPEARPVVANKVEPAGELEPTQPPEPGRYSPVPAAVDPPIQPAPEPAAATPATSATELPAAVVPAVVNEALVPSAPEPASTPVQQMSAVTDSTETESNDPYVWARGASRDEPAADSAKPAPHGSPMWEVARDRRGVIIAPRPQPQQVRSPRRL